MRTTLLLLLSSGLLACGPQTAQDEALEVPGARHDAVLGGKVTFEEPSVFLLHMRYEEQGSFICTGTLIDRRILLTAAHCVEPDSEGRLPTTRATNRANLDFPDGGTFIKASRLRVHPWFKDSTLAYDVAVVELEKEPPTPVVRANTTPLGDSFINVPVRVVGYGITSTLADDSGLKRAGDTIISRVERSTFDFGQIGRVTSGTCSGDSGGPTMAWFPDGTRRTIGIHSYHTGECGRNTDQRVDRHAITLNNWLNELNAPACEADGRCAAGCTTVDPDCGCEEDGQCNAACVAPGVDADCDTACGADGVCSNATCAVADPDCQPTGAPCGHDGHCNSRSCITSAQAARPYCTQPCAGATDCPSGLSCVQNRCELNALPQAAEGEACTVDATWCGGPALTCATWERDAAPKCSRVCYEHRDCNKVETCVSSPQAPGICIPSIVVTRLKTEEWKVQGCASAAFSAPLTWLAALFFARRRRFAKNTMRRA